MTLAVGTTLGSYSVTAKIGEGGMGELWRARDTKLGREVALKTLPEEFAKDDDRLAGPFPVDEALPRARQIAEALEAAHESSM